MGAQTALERGSELLRSIGLSATCHRVVRPGSNNQMRKELFCAGGSLKFSQRRRNGQSVVREFHHFQMSESNSDLHSFRKMFVAEFSVSV